ncbi:hypothetical protein [Aquipuribacter nitratireducens]|uniref:Uncharacterized protein n=1 Tax=Aquipuribacter nitratireducens TaxID=650104 RepID=A0ABW0GN18_9MICO
MDADQDPRTGVALPGDRDLSLDLVGLVLRAVVRDGTRFLLRAGGGRGTWTSGGRRHTSGDGPPVVLDLSFVLADPADAPAGSAADAAYEVLLRWRDTGTALRLVGAPGKEHVLFEPGGTAVPVGSARG